MATVATVATAAEELVACGQLISTVASSSLPRVTERCNSNSDMPQHYSLAANVDTGCSLPALPSAHHHIRLILSTRTGGSSVRSAGRPAASAVQFGEPPMASISPRCRPSTCWSASSHSTPVHPHEQGSAPIHVRLLVEFPRPALQASSACACAVGCGPSAGCTQLTPDRLQPRHDDPLYAMCIRSPVEHARAANARVNANSSSEGVSVLHGCALCSGRRASRRFKVHVCLCVYA